MHFSARNFTGWGSEGVNDILQHSRKGVSVGLSQNYFLAHYN